MLKRTNNGKAEKITRDDPLWPRLFARHIAELDKMLADWKPEV